MPSSEDARTSMKYLDHLRGVALAGVRLIQEKTRTYGPSWKRRLGAGAWFTTVRPWDRLETIVERHGGDIFAAIEEHPLGGDGTALDAIRDVRNYLLLIEAEMVARGVVAESSRNLAEELDNLPERTERQTDEARARGGDMYAGERIPGKKFSSLDLGTSPDLWSTGLNGLPDRPFDNETTHSFAMGLRDLIRRYPGDPFLIASRQLTSGDYQVVIRIPA